MKDPKTGNLIVSNTEIKRVTLEYCKDNLTQSKFEDGFENEKVILEDLHNERMDERNDEKLDIERGDFDKVVQKCTTFAKRNYDFLVKSGTSYKSAMYVYTKRMIREECFPGSFNKTVLHMIFKGGKGKKEDLSSNRFIHCKSWLPRLTEGLLVNEMRKTILRSSSSRLV